MAEFRHALLVVNPVSGLQLGPRAARAIARRLQERGLETTTRQTAGPGDASLWAQEAGSEGFDVVVAIGGDGTVQEVVAGMLRAERRIPVAHYPIGSANIIALCLALPWLPRPAGDVIADGRTVPFDIGWLPEQGRCFVLMATIGYPARIVRDAPRRWKNLFGVLSYAGAAVRNLFLPGHSAFRLEADGRTLQADAHTILIANLGQIRQLGLKVAPGTSPHDGRLDVSVIGSHTFWDLVVIIWRLLTLRRAGDPRLQMLQAGRLVVRADPPAPVQVDGESIGTTPLTAEILPAAVHLVVPKSYQVGAARGEEGAELVPAAPSGGRRGRLRFQARGRGDLGQEARQDGREAPRPVDEGPVA